MLRLVIGIGPFCLSFNVCQLSSGHDGSIWICNYLVFNAAATTKNAVATLIAFCSTFSRICLIYLYFILNFLYINYVDIQFYYSNFVIYAYKLIDWLADNNNLSDTWFWTILFVGNMIQSGINLGTGCCAGDLTFYGEVWWFRDADMRSELS